MKLKKLITAAGFAIAIASGFNWNVDTANAKIKFTVKGPFGSVHGNFSGIKASINFDPNKLSQSSISARIDAKTVSTGIGLRNHDLRSKKIWLDTDEYPEISFRSNKIEKTDKGYKAIGVLTLKGIVKSIEIPFTFAEKGESAGVFQGDFSINREDYHIGKKGGSVGDIIKIELIVPVKK